MSHNPQWNSFQSPSQPGMKSYSNYHAANSGYHSSSSYHGSSSHSPPGARYGGGGASSSHYGSQSSDSGGGGGGGAEFDIGVFSVGNFSSSGGGGGGGGGGGHKNGYGVNGFAGKEGSPSHAGHGLRETGIIEKLLVSARWDTLRPRT